MATSNFHNVNASAIFAVPLENDFDYEDLVDNLKSELSNDSDYVDYGKTDHNECRSFPSRTLGSIRKYHQYKDFYVEVCVTPVIRSGYYEGVNLDWNVDYLINGDASYDSPDFYINDIAHYGNLPKSKATTYAKLAEKKAEKLKNEIVEKLESIYSDYSMKLGVTARFSNGETIYHKVA
jgi:hypothetical protein